MTDQKGYKPNRMRPFRRIIIILSVLTMVLPLVMQAQQQESNKFSLKEAQEYAIQHNYDIIKSQLDVEASKKRRKETVADGLPQLNSSISYLNNLELRTVLIPNFFEGKFDEKIPVQFGTQHNVDFGITLEQKIFDFSYIVGLHASKVYQQFADQGFERTKLDVKETVTSAYFLILVFEETEKIIRANIANLEKTHYETQERYKEGFVEETDVDNLQISLTQLENSLQSTQKQTEVAYKMLNFQLGLPLEGELMLDDKLEDILRQIDISESLSTAFNLSQNIDFQLLNTQAKLAELSLKNEKAKYWPSISAFYTYQQSAFRDSFNVFSYNKEWFRSQILGVNVRIPIFKSGGQKAKVQQAAIALEQARTAMEQASQGILLEDANARNSLSASYENYLNVRSNMELTQKVYEATLAKYEEGLASSLELTQANDRYLLVQSNYIRALSELLIAKNTLDRIRNNY
ncbi:TolC family protein [Acidobacteriota bacterium]